MRLKFLPKQFAFVLCVSTIALSSSAKPSQAPTEMVLEEPEASDPQRIALGLSIGAGWLTSKGSGLGVFGSPIEFTGTFGLGTGGARHPLALEAFVGFTMTKAVFTGKEGPHPNRFTDFGLRAVFRDESGFFNRHWFALGLGLAFTSWGVESTCSDKASCVMTSGNIKPGMLIDTGIGIYEWIFFRSRLGMSLHMPVQISSHPGVGVFLSFGGQVGLAKR